MKLKRGSIRKSFAWVAGLALALPVSGALAEEQVKPIREVFEPSGDYDPEKFAKVAVVQWNPAPAQVGEDVTQRHAEEFKARNRAEIERYVREAASNGAELVVTPEFGVVGYPDLPGVPSEEDEFRNRDDIKPYVETVPGPTTRHFSRVASELGIYVHVGFAEVDRATDVYYNTVVAIDPRGRIVAKYRKINLYQDENKFLSPGRDIATYDSPFGKVGLIICADVYSSNPMSRYVSAGAKVLALSTSWAQMNTGMDYFKRSARSNRVYILAANQTYFPDSGVVNPDGTTQSHIRQSEGVAYGYLPRVKR